METAQTGLFGISAARITAYGAVALLCGVVVWNMTSKPALVASNTAISAAKQESELDLSPLATNTNEELIPSSITPLGASIFANAVLAYGATASSTGSDSEALAAVQKYGESIVTPVDFRTYLSSDIKTVPDTSKDRALSYRADLRVALEPLLANKDYELDLFAQYVDTKKPEYLQQLRVASGNYKLAITNTEKVVAPADAASFHAAILTALSKFASTLDALVEYADDPFASAALLRTFVDAQTSVVVAFDSIGKYAAQKLP